MSLVFTKSAANGGMFSMDLANTDPAIGWEFKGMMEDNQIQYVNQFIAAIRAGQEEIVQVIPQVFPQVYANDAQAVYQEMFVNCDQLWFNGKVLIDDLGADEALDSVLERVAVEMLEFAA